MNLLPLFKSHYSIGRSILTLDSKSKESEPQKVYPDSIIDLAIRDKISPVVMVEDSISGYLEAYTNLQEAKIPLIFGLRLTATKDMDKKDDDSLEAEHKIVVFAKNTNGYKRLIKISTAAAIRGFYYTPRIDFTTLQGMWSDEDLLLGIPFYDSFIFYNVMHRRVCIPDFGFTKPVFFIESNLLPFDCFVAEAVRKFVKQDYETINAKSIYYDKRKDFKAYLTFRCINNRSSLNEPKLEHMSSAEFCLEAYKEKASV